jgi:alpha-tubulin suppressor-like RCC1 family protein
MDRSKSSKSTLVILTLACIVGLTTLMSTLSTDTNNLAFARTTGAGLYAFGSNAHGVTGLGTSSGSTVVPAAVGEELDWTHVSAGGSFSLAINERGELYAWGNNAGGQTGLGLSEGSTRVPTLVCNKRNWTAIDAGWDHSLGIADGKLYAWGYNSTGQTGLATLTGTTLVPTLVDDTETWTHISAGGTETAGHSLAITSKGDLYSWGSNEQGRTGFNTTLGNINIPLLLSNSHTWVQVAAGSTHSLALTDKGDLYAWGSNLNGLTGLNQSSGNTLTPTLVSNSRNWTDIAAGQIQSLAIADQGDLYAWGNNMNGATGLGKDSGTTLVPTLVNSQETWVSVQAVPARNSSGAVTSDNRIFMWGLGQGGRLGTGDSQNRLTPTHIATVTGLKDFVGGGTHSFIIAETLFLPGEEEPLRPWILPTPVELSKTLQLNSGVAIPDLDFSFAFTPERIALASETNGSLLYSVDHELAIPTQTLNISSNNHDDLREAGGVISLTQTLDLGEALYSINFPHEGMYVWLVSEVSGSSNTAFPAHVDYSPALYELRIQVNNNRSIEIIEFATKVADNEGQDLGSKSDSVLFTNTYTKQIGEEGYTGANALAISKTIPNNEANAFADLTTPFKFNLTLTKIALASDAAPQLDFPLTAYIVDNTTETYLRKEVVSSLSHDFDLRHNERLLIPTLPAGTSFKVSEFPDLNFAASFKLHLEDGSVITDAGQPAVALATGTHFIAENGKSLVEFTNNFNFVPPTGLALAHFPYAAVGVFALLLILSTVVLKRRNIERLTMLN